MIYVYTAFEWNSLPLRRLANQPCKGFGKRKRNRCQKSMNVRYFILSCPCAVKVMLNTQMCSGVQDFIFVYSVGTINKIALLCKTEL